MENKQIILVPMPFISAYTGAPQVTAYLPPRHPSVPCWPFRSTVCMYVQYRPFYTTVSALVCGLRYEVPTPGPERDF